MRSSSATLAALLILPAAFSGCKPAGRAYSSIQYHNLDVRLVRTTMTITLGSGAQDARRYMDAERYAGACSLGSVTVRYPEGFRATAVEVARAFADTANLVAIKLGAEWSFAPEIRLARLPDSVDSLVYSVPLRHDRKLVFPVFINQSGQIRADWAPVVAHELTEASLIAPRDRRKMVLDDACSPTVCINTHTRWFRDGVSDRAGDILGARLYPGRYFASAYGYSQLAAVRSDLLDWSNSPGVPNYYPAASALIREAEKAAGEDAAARVMSSLASEDVPGGRGLRRAFERETGIDLPGFLERYTLPWLGADFSDIRPDRLNPPLVLTDNRVIISRVGAASPASRYRLRAGDIVESVDGVPVRSVRQLRSAIAAHKPGDLIELDLIQGGGRRLVRVKLAARPRAANVNGGFDFAAELW